MQRADLQNYYNLSSTVENCGKFYDVGIAETSYEHS